MDKKLIFTLSSGFLVIVAALSAIWRGSHGTHHPLEGKPLLERAFFQVIDEIQISKPVKNNDGSVTDTSGEKNSGSKPDNSLTMKLFKNNQWVLSSANNFPVSGIKLARTIDDLVATKIVRVVSTKDGTNQDFGIEEGAKAVLLSKGTEKVRWTFGNVHGGGGQYVKLNTGPEIFLVDRNRQLGAQATDWEEKELVHVNAGEVVSIEFMPAAILHKTPIALENKSGRFIVSSPEGVKHVDKWALNGAGNLLKHLTSSVHVENTNEQMRQVFASPSRAIVKLANQMEYRIDLGDQMTPGGERKYFVRILELRESQPTDSLLNQIMQRWAFELPAWSAARFEKGLEDFLTKNTKNSDH